MKKRKDIIKIAIDSPAASGAGTLSKAISKEYNLLSVDTGKAYRLIALYKIKFPKKFNLNFLKKKIDKLNIKDLNQKELLSDEVGTVASIIAKKKIFGILFIIFKKNWPIILQKNIQVPA